MLISLRRAFNLLSFSRQFMLAIVTVLVIGTVVIGSWIGNQIESSEVSRAASMSAIYVESIFGAQLHDWPGGEIVDAETHAVLDRVFVQGPLHREVVRFKLWDASGRIVYSNDNEQIGRRFQLRKHLTAAFSGEVRARISTLDDADNWPEHARWPRLLEVYVPIRSGAHSDVIAVAEVYYAMDTLGQEIHAAQQRSWALVTFATLAIYLLLYGLVRRANETIHTQQRDMSHQLQQLRTVLEENDHMRERLREAGVSMTTLNEEFLIRIAADLHDGPAQTIAFALMRLDEFAETCHGCIAAKNEYAQELPRIQGALQSSLRDVRKISSGLALPGMMELSLANTARRAVLDFERLSGQKVMLENDEVLDSAPLAVKITVYRLIQESLTNSWRHAPGGTVRVHVHQTGDEVVVTITDQGAGFDTQAVAVGGRLGLAFMRERVRLLGGVFDVDSAPGRGTVIRARLSLSTDEMIHV
jgi:signal transduction histidine kinase